MKPLAGKTALVTGAARGIGRAIAERLAQRGMRLALVDRDVIRLAATRRSVERSGVEVVAIPCDLSQPSQVEALAKTMLARWAGVDLLVNNAAVAHYGPTGEMTPTEIERLLKINLHAPIALTHALLPAMLARPEAHLLNVCSVLGLVAMPRVSAYCTSKHALVGFSDSLRAEYARRGLGVTTLCPGFVRTQLLDDAPADGRDRRPPALLCVSVDRVARAAVRAVEHNQGRVVVDPVGRIARWAINTAPGLFDWMHALGRSKRVAQKQAQLAALDEDQELALRKKLGLLQEKPPRKFAA